jgi:hypothetical protein
VSRSRHPGIPRRGQPAGANRGSPPPPAASTGSPSLSSYAVENTRQQRAGWWAAKAVTATRARAWVGDPGLRS